MKKKILAFLGMSIILALLFAGCTADLDSGRIVGDRTAAASYPSLIVEKGLPDDIEIFVAERDTSATAGTAQTAAAAEKATGWLYKGGLLVESISVPDFKQSEWLAERGKYPFPKPGRKDLKLSTFFASDTDTDDGTLTSYADGLFAEIAAVAGTNPDWTSSNAETQAGKPYKPAIPPAIRLGGNNANYFNADGQRVLPSQMKAGDTVYCHLVVTWVWSYEIPVIDPATGAQKRTWDASLKSGAGDWVYETATVAASGSSTAIKKFPIEIKKAPDLWNFDS